jgi:Uncharacterized conserved protein
MKKFLVVFEKTKTGFSAYAPDLPGCIATGRTKNETAHRSRDPGTTGSPDRDLPQEKSSAYSLPLPEPAGIGRPSSSARSPRKRSAGDLHPGCDVLPHAKRFSLPERSLLDLFPGRSSTMPEHPPGEGSA